MRVFWAIIGVLVLVTGALFALGGSGEGSELAESVGDRDAQPAFSERADDASGADAAQPRDDREDTGDNERAADEQVVASTAEPGIQEVESVEAGLAEKGIVVVEEAPTPGETAGDVADGGGDDESEVVAGDGRDGEQVVLDAITAQNDGQQGSEGDRADAEEGVESDWLVADAERDEDAPAERAEQDGESVERAEAPEQDEVAEEGGVVADASAVESPASDDATSASDETAGSSSEPASGGDGSGAAVTSGEETSGDPLGELGELLKDDSAKAPAGPEGTVERRDDGGLLVNGEIVVKGEGTQASPYEVPWDLLVSASRTYAPEKGKEQLPAWAMELDGAWVRVRGYVLMPVMAADTKELLVMLNQWDGCCIGVPPTPYDAAEVRLKRSVEESGGGSFVNYASIKGKLDVDPYMVGGWLMGLYVIEEGEIEVGSGREGT